MSLRIATAVTATWMSIALGACSGEEEQPMNTTPFEFLAGDWGVSVTARATSCATEIFVPREAWVVSTYLASVSAMTIPDPSAVPLLLTPGAEPVPVTGDGTTTGTAVPPSFTGLMNQELGWSPSREEERVTSAGCLERRTTVLGIQFTPDGQLFGVRSIFREYVGGADCPVSCRSTFELQGALGP